MCVVSDGFSMNNRMSLGLRLNEQLLAYNLRKLMLISIKMGRIELLVSVLTNEFF